MDTLSGTTKMTTTRIISLVSYQTASMAETQESISAVGMTNMLLTSLIFPLTSPSFYSSLTVHLCQTVNGTKMREEYSRWDNEDDSGYITDLEDKHAYLEHSLNNLKPTTVITINSHTNVKFSRLHYLLQSILRYYCTGNL